MKVHDSKGGVLRCFLNCMAAIGVIILAACFPVCASGG